MMSDSKPQNIVYLFGAGATHAEITNLFPNWFTDGVKSRKESLLLKDVSLRICREAKLKPWFKKWKQTRDFEDIELFISLIKDNRVESDATVKGLQKLLEKDITSKLGEIRQRRFYLHRAFFELHKKTDDKETLVAIISLNYDDVLDKSYERVFKEKPNYSLFSNPAGRRFILKLHGGFTLKNKKTGRKILIIPPGTRKNYLEFPYNFIWGRALESLIECDILRVVGCSFSANDIGLIDLIFKANLERKSKNKLEIQLINDQQSGVEIKERFGFFPGIKTIEEIKERGYQTSLVPRVENDNPFKSWLLKKIEIMIPNDDDINKTEFIKKLINS
ncbi:hypothetical protein IH982_01525 [Patescibacteria group bacterium]|nr:hypothetical protein [Patescibacteria group bacterium]